MTRNQIVPHTHWNKYLSAVSERYHEQPVDLNLERPGAPVRTIASGLYFMGAALEGGHQGALVIHLGRLGEPERHFSHRIPAPMLLLREEDAQRQIDRIVIESANRERTWLVFDDGCAAPGMRHLAAQLDHTSCDHPRCPLPAA